METRIIMYIATAEYSRALGTQNKQIGVYQDQLEYCNFPI